MKKLKLKELQVYKIDEVVCLNAIGGGKSESSVRKQIEADVNRVADTTTDTTTTDTYAEIYHATMARLFFCPTISDPATF